MKMNRINHWKHVLVAAVSLLTLAVSAQADGLPRSGWPKSHADAGNTGAAPRTGSGLGKSAQGKLKWRVKYSASTDVVVGPNGTVYTGGENAPHAFAAETGLPVSCFQFEVSPDDAGIPSKPGYGPSNYHRPVRAADGSLHVTSYYTPALAEDGTLFVSGDSDNIYAVDGRTGRKLWKFVATAPCFSSPTIGADGTVYAGCQDFEVYALDRATGRKRWGFRAGDRIEGTPALGPDGTVYAGSMDGRVLALDGQTGKKKWEFVTAGYVRLSPCLGTDGTLYVLTTYGRVYALDSRTGKKKWGRKMKGWTTSAPVLGPDQTLYLTATDHLLHAVNGKTGQDKWTLLFKPSVFLSSFALASDGTLYIGADRLYAVDTHTRTRKWTFLPGGSIKTSPAIGADGTVYFTAGNGYLYAVK